jgi:uncharacterized protein (DUF305 family)
MHGLVILPPQHRRPAVPLLLHSADDPRMSERADGVIEAQREEIAEMKVLINDLENSH